MIGVYVDNLVCPWMPSVYRLAENLDTVIFTNNLGPIPPNTKCSILTSSYIWSCDDPIIATDMFSASYLARCPIPKRRLFYINQIDWINPQFFAMDNLEVFNTLELLTEPHFADTIKSVWKEPLIIEDWNHETIQRILS